jgi:hypothetical protein
MGFSRGGKSTTRHLPSPFGFFEKKNEERMKYMKY